MWRRAILLGTIAAVLVLFFAAGLYKYLSLDWVRARHGSLVAAYASRPAVFVTGFIAVQALALAFCVPGAVLVPAVAAGAIFGAVTGTLVVLTGLTLGDSLGFLAARYLFRQWAERWLDRQMERVDEEVELNGVFYLLTLRLLAIVPFFVVNISLALTRMPLLLFAPVSFVGLIPATIIYVNAGQQIGAIRNASDIYSTSLLASFALLALVPLAIRFLLRRRSARSPKGSRRVS